MADGNGSIAELSDSKLKHEQRSVRGKAYDEWLSELRHTSSTKGDFRKRRTSEFVHMRNVGPSQVHSNAFMSNLSVQYANDEFIGEQLMPVLPVTKRSDNFPTYSKRDRTEAPDDEMTGKSTPNELSETRGSDNYSVKDYALVNNVEYTTIENEDDVFDEMLDLVEALNDTLALKREMRIASVMTTPANFGGNTVTLSGADQWNSGAGGNPIKNIQEAVASCWSGHGPGDLIGYCSLDVWNVLARHGQNLDLFKYTMDGLTKMDRLAKEFGLAKILVGAARKDAVNPGQAASYARIWGKHFGVARVARRASKRNASFGYTVRMKADPHTTEWYDPSKGSKGSYFARVAFSEQHKVCAGDTGALIVDAIA